MVKKPDGKCRMCLDFLEVNKVTKKELYLISLMNEILGMWRSANYIPKIDLKYAYL